jgi:hypothetical protein
VQPVQLAPFNQIIGGPLVLASAFLKGPSADVRPRAAAEVVQYCKKSRLKIFIILSSSSVAKQLRKPSGGLIDLR